MLLDEDCHCRPLLKRLREEDPKSTCSKYASSRGAGQVVFSYSLYGERKINFLPGVEDNLKGLREHYPGGLIRLYYDKNPTDLKTTLDAICEVFCKNPEVDLCNVKNLGINIIKIN